jgi:predicted nucleic acid-binding protein
MLPVPIDLAFVTKYVRGEVPDLKSGDMIFVMLAKVDGLDLITEDGRMISEARRLGTSAYTIGEYLSSRL